MSSNPQVAQATQRPDSDYQTAIAALEESIAETHTLIKDLESKLTPFLYVYKDDEPKMGAQTAGDGPAALADLSRMHHHSMTLNRQLRDILGHIVI